MHPKTPPAATPDLAPAGIEYHGVAGSSEDCRLAILRLLQCGPSISAARVITTGNAHCLLLTTDVGDPVAVKSGFSSGYGGQGPAVLSAVLQLLARHGADIDEVEVQEAVFERIDASALTADDMILLKTSAPVRPSRWRDYVSGEDFERGRKGALGGEFPELIPFALVDPRLMDLAETFAADPDARLLTAYRRLEDAVRERTGLRDHNTRLFSAVFGKDGLLTWEVTDDNERQGRANLFSGVFMAYRNPRAHRELSVRDAVSEFLLVNHLFRLEAEAKPVGEIAARS